jgi:hypothetical protein
VLQFHPTCSLLAKNHINEHRNEKYRALRGVQFLRYKFSSASILNQILGNSRSIYHPVEGGCWHLEEGPGGGGGGGPPRRSPHGSSSRKIFLSPPGQMRGFLHHGNGRVGAGGGLHSSKSIIGLDLQKADIHQTIFMITSRRAKENKSAKRIHHPLARATDPLCG